MAEDIWEESDFTVKAKVSDDASKPYTGKVDLKYVKNGDMANPLQTETDLSLTDGKLEHTYKVPKVGPEEATYNLSVLASYGKEKKTTTDVADAVVWPKTVSIHAKNEKNDNAKQVPLMIVQRTGQVDKPVTGDDGKCTGQLKEKAPYSIAAFAPWSIIKNEEDPKKKRVHELTVQRQIVAMFVTPDVTNAPYEASDSASPAGGSRQFVNLTTKTDGSDAMGNEVTFVVSANPKADGRKDDPIYIQVTFSRESKRNDPKPALLNNPAVTDLKKDAAEKVFTGYVKLDADAGTAKFKVNLGLAGGDTCTVAIGGRKDTCTDASLTLVNWRKLYYELRFPTLLKPKLSDKQDYADDMRGKAAAKLAKAFVVYEMFKNFEFPDADATIAKKNGTMVAAAYLKDASGGNRYLVTNGILNTTGKFSGDAGTKKQSIYVSLCERAFSSNKTDHTMAPQVESADFDVPSPENYLFEPRTNDGNANLKVGAYKWKAVIANAHDQATKLVFDPADKPQASGAVAGKVRIVELRRTGKTQDVTFAAKTGGGYETTLAAGQKTAVETFVAGLLTDLPGLREAGNQVTLKLVGDDSDADGLARFNAVKSAAQAKFTAAAGNVKYHPGLDKNGVAREGAMNLAWLSFKDYKTIRVQLPTSPGGTPDHQKVLPGDFAGASETDTQCKVMVKFDLSTAGEINGNSGGGEQIMVLRAAATVGAISETVCHELGHSMGMTIVPGLNNDVPPPGLTVKHCDNGGTSYVNGDAPYAFNDGKRNIHKGGHCCTGVPAAKLAHEKFDGWSPAADGCIMWGSGGNTETRPKYCDTCVEIIKARRLEDIRSEWDGRAAGKG